MDKILYKVITNGGGMDGMDRNDKGGKVWFAAFDRAAAEKKLDNWKHLEMEAVDVDQLKKDAYRKLNQVDRLALDLDQNFKPKHLEER